jgi:tRNA nucleotidyltransferase/poly(A) polymerase
VILKVL